MTAQGRSAASAGFAGLHEPEVALRQLDPCVRGQKPEDRHTGGDCRVARELAVTFAAAFVGVGPLPSEPHPASINSALPASRQVPAVRLRVWKLYEGSLLRMNRFTMHVP